MMTRRLVLLCALSLLLPLGLAPPASAYVGTHIGGVGIHHPVSSTRATVCSTAFNAVNAGGGAVAITAGHCGARGSLWYSRRGGSLLGRMTRTRNTNDPRGDDDDYAVIRSSGKYRLPPRVKDRGVSKTVARVGRLAVGQVVCFTGRSSGTKCGRVRRVRSNGVIITTMTPRRGDSGGPLFHPIRGTRRVAALGIVVGSDGTRGYHQRLREVLREYDLRLRTA